MDPDNIPTMVLLPMPFLPSSPVTWPFLGTGSLYRRKEFLPYWCTLSLPVSEARLTTVMASNGQTFTHMPQPLQTSSSMRALPVCSSTATQSAPDLLTGQYFTHSSPHFLGWQTSLSRTATLCDTAAPGRGRA